MRFVRVKDKATGHEFDVPEGDRRIGVSLEALPKKGTAAMQRRPKHHLKLAGRTASRETASAPAPEATSTEENSHG